MTTTNNRFSELSAEERADISLALTKLAVRLVCQRVRVKCPSSREKRIRALLNELERRG